MTPRNVELHIEELVLHGFASGDRHRISIAVQHELARMFAEREMPSSLFQSGEAVRLNGGTFTVVPGSQAETLGVQVAQAVYGGLSRA